MRVIVGIDTSCDDTGVGIVRDRDILANIVASQTALHAPYGGVVPEQASREHLDVIDHVLGAALAEAGLRLDEVEAISATYGPGLVGTLLVGLQYAKALAWSRGLPFIPVHHLEGHIASSLSEGLAPPFLCLIASGGHTHLFDVGAWGEYRLVGHTRDDAAGEAFDKVARLLNLPYPGGPALSELARSGDPAAHPFPLPMARQTGYDFSFSGLKTAVGQLLRKQPEVKAEDVAASFEKTVVESLVSVTERAAAAAARTRVVVAGGVAANTKLRERFAETGLELHFPPLDLATDNGAMIALAASYRRQPATDTREIDAVPYAPLAVKRDESARP